MADQTKYTGKLKGKKVLITGGTSGIGFAVAEALVEHGSTVIVSSSQQKRVDEAIARLNKSYPSAKGRISGHACNLGDEATLEQNVVGLLDKAGKVDHIIHTAGDSLATSAFEETSFAQIKQAGMVRYFAPMLIGKHAKKYLNAGPESSFTITTGSVSEKPIAGWAAVAPYATGLHGMTKSLALELKPIRVNCVSPGAVETELWDGLGAEEKAKLMETLKGHMLTGVVPGPEQVAEAYVYLLKDYNITGSIISTNGGGLIA